LVVLGSTGSIGTQTLSVVKDFSDKFSVVGLAAGRNIGLLAKQIVRFQPRVASVAYKESVPKLRSILPESNKTQIVYGIEGCTTVAVLKDADLVVSAIQGSQGLMPTYSAIKAGKDIALANKEILVMAGELVMKEIRKSKSTIFPIDSEHSAIFQAISGHRKRDIEKIMLTASGGPFLHCSRRRLMKVTPEEALKHPRWRMGKKISTDSASLMNKGLEAIEAHWLFNVAMDKIEIVIHPESIIHSMVEYKDGAIIAQLSIPDMRIPIAYALSYPQRLELPLSSLDLFQIRRLTFLKPDYDKFPCIGLAYETMEAGGTMPVVLNAANEVAVASFLGRRIIFSQIPTLIRKTMDSHKVLSVRSIKDVESADHWARLKARALTRQMEEGSK
jgi:1-deoxy-D-xylulose-5-phosphate reductoisomerase